MNDLDTYAPAHRPGCESAQVSASQASIWGPAHAVLHGGLLCGLGLFASACSSSGGVATTGEGSGALLGGHIGPAVAASPAEGSGPSRFVAPLLEGFDSDAAMAVATDLDGFYRSPASDGYERAMDRVIAGLYGAGFGGDAGFELQILSEAMAGPAWTPISAEINVLGMRGGDVFASAPLAGFSDPSDEFRLLIAEGAPSCEVRGPAVFRLEDVTPGVILVTKRSVRNVEQEAVEKGAVAIVSWFQLPYCDDPTGQDRQIEAIFQGSVRPGATIPSFYVSPRMADAMELASKRGSSFELVARVRREVRPLRTAVATIRGAERPGEAVYIVSAVSGAGANDNAAGAAGILEGARALKRLIDAGVVERPRRTIHFAFGKEAEAGGTALDGKGDTAVAAVVADMIGASYAKTGAICLLERGWDPAAILSYPPDAHTPWGAGSLAEEDILPNGLAIILREALVDVGLAVAEESGAPWSTREHPWEGGSDHDTFLGRGIAAALVWHFTDFAYSTSLDRMDHVDAEELRRTSVAILAAAAAVADARPSDLGRYMESLAMERSLRLKAASAAKAPVGLSEIWIDWFSGAEQWLQSLTAGEALPEFDGLRAIDSIETSSR